MTPEQAVEIASRHWDQGAAVSLIAAERRYVERLVAGTSREVRDHLVWVVEVATAHANYAVLVDEHSGAVVAQRFKGLRLDGSEPGE